MDKIKKTIKYLNESKCDQKQGESYQEYHNEMLNIAIQALEKEVPRKVCWTLECYIEKWHCPTCGRIYWEKEFIDYHCSSCGQKLEVQDD